MGDISMIDSLIVIWPDNKLQKLANIHGDETIVVKQREADRIYSWKQSGYTQGTLFKEISDSLNLEFSHQQNDYVDFYIQKLLPHKLSQYGPAIAVGDINGDGLEDIVIGGAANKSAVIFFQNKYGKFEKKNLLDSSSASLKLSDDVGILLFDADGDHDLDMYLCSGGNEQKSGSACYQDRLYINDGKGNFKLDAQALPVNHTSKSCVRAIDFDKDGDLDLFIGERVEPGAYPKPVSGIILRNDSKNGVVKFTDVTKSIAPALQNIGLICDAVSVDYNNDGWPDLVLAGEWMPITFLRNQNGVFVNETLQSGIGDKFGWWNSLCIGDFNNDGKIDFIAGNLGENSFFKGNEIFPVNNYFNDFDRNGTVESITTKFMYRQIK